MTNFTEQMQSFSVQMEQMKKEMTEKIKSLMAPAFKEFFDRHPTVKYVSWTQYTPYFNDGEPCEFGVHEKSISIREDAKDFSEYDEDEDVPVWLSYDSLPNPDNRSWYEKMLTESKNEDYYKEKLQQLDDPNLAPIFTALEDLKSFDSIPEEVYQTLGEGRVFVSRDGIDVEEYDHD